jgi:hypothetical protein
MRDGGDGIPYCLRNPFVITIHTEVDLRVLIKGLYEKTPFGYELRPRLHSVHVEIFYMYEPEHGVSEPHVQSMLNP